MSLDPKMLLLLVPIILIQLGLMIFSLIKLIRSDKTKHMNKPIWALIICLFNLVGPILYLIIEGGENDSN